MQLQMPMESSSKLHPQNLQNPHDHFEWPYHEDLFSFDKSLELPPLDIDGFLDDFNKYSHSFPFHNWDNISELEAEIFLPEDKQQHMIPLPPLNYYDFETAVANEAKPIRMMKVEDDETARRRIMDYDQLLIDLERSGISSCWKEQEQEQEQDYGDGEKMRLRSRLMMRNGRRKSSVLGLEEIQKHFHIPISEAAKEMNVGLTVLKKRCRELNIMRWPHRKLKSLKSLIQNVKDMGLTNEVRGLEEHKRLVEELPDMDLTHRTKRLRQACFKANYKKKRTTHTSQ